MFQRLFGKFFWWMQPFLSREVKGAVAEQLKDIEERLIQKIERLSELYRPTRLAENQITERILGRIGHSPEDVVNLISIMEKPIWEAHHSVQWLLSVGADFKEARLVRFVPIRIYLKSMAKMGRSVEFEAADAIVPIIAKWLEADFIPSTDFGVEAGSAWKRFWVKTKDKLTQHETEDKLAAALELKHLDMPQAEATKLLAEGTSAVLKELDGVDDACIQVGNALIVKRTIDGKAHVSVRTLTPLQLKRLEENHTLLFDPQKTLDMLAAPPESL